MSRVFANREVCDLIFCDYKTKAPILNCDFANTTTTSFEGESVFAYGGKGHPKKVTFYGEKGGTITVETQMQSAQLYSIMTGAAIANTAKFIKREVVAATSGSITLSTAPAGGTVSVFAEDDDCGTPIENTVSSTTVTLGGEYEASSDTFIVYYLEEIATGVKTLNIKSTTFPNAVTMYADTYMKAEDDTIIPYKMTVYKATPQTTFEIGFSNNGDPATLTLTFDLLADEDDNMVDMILMEDE